MLRSLEKNDRGLTSYVDERGKVVEPKFGTAFGACEPPRCDDESLAAVAEVLAHLDAALRPAEERQVKGRVAALLSHYYTPDQDERLWSMVYDDWWCDLRSYPFWAIEAACADYRRTEERIRPTPAMIVRSCEHMIRDHGVLAERLRQTLAANDAPQLEDRSQDYELTDEQRERIGRMFDEFHAWAKARGGSSHAHAASHG